MCVTVFQYLYLWTLKLEFHVIFTCHKIWFFWFFPPTILKCKSLSYFMGCTKKLVVGQICPWARVCWPLSCWISLPYTPIASHPRLPESAYFPLPAQGLYCSNILFRSGDSWSPLRMCPRLVYPSELWWKEIQIILLTGSRCLSSSQKRAVMLMLAGHTNGKLLTKV